MRPPLVRQPSRAPTRKLATGALTAGVVGAAFREVWVEIAAESYPMLTGPAVSLLIEATVAAIAGLIAGYFVKDRANVVTPTE